jgi:cytochrome P450
MVTLGARLLSRRESRLPLAPPLSARHPLGQMPEMRADPVRLLLRTFNELGDTGRFRIAYLSFTCAFHPRDVERVLKDNVANYTKHSPGYEKLKLLLGNGLVTSTGDFWLRQRRIAQPAFHRKRIEGFADTMVRAGLDLTDGWERYARDGGVVDIHHEMMRVTLRIAGETLLSHDPSAEADEIGEALTLGLRYFDESLHSLVPRFEKVPLPRNLRARRALERLDDIVRGIIQERRTGEAKNDLLSMLMDARHDETGEGMTDEQLRDEVMTMFLAGHETTANALSWTLMLLSRHPDVAARLERELDEVLEGRPPSLADLPRLVYTAQVLKESMRLFPPVWMMGRRVEADDELGGYLVPKGSYVFVSQYVTHRHPAFWDNPEGFDPDRFAPERVAEDKERGRPRYAYFPFSGGPRQCIGNHMAEMEAQLLLATVLQRFRLSLVPGYRVELDPSVTLRPKHGVPMTLAVRGSRR